LHCSSRLLRLCYLYCPLRALLLFSLLIPRPPISPLFPYTTLFRSTTPVPCGRPVRSRSRCTTPPSSPSRSTTTSPAGRSSAAPRSEEHTSELQSRENLVCRLLLEKKKKKLDNRWEVLSVLRSSRAR